MSISGPVVLALPFRAHGGSGTARRIGCRATALSCSQRPTRSTSSLFTTVSRRRCGTGAHCSPRSRTSGSTRSASRFWRPPTQRRRRRTTVGRITWHVARGSAPMPYALTQPSRIRRGAGAIAGNHVILQITGGGEYVVLAHLRCGSSSDAAGTARPGRPAACYLWQLWQLHPATSAHPGHGLGRPVHR
jgi:hypothetical protein